MGIQHAGLNRIGQGAVTVNDSDGAFGQGPGNLINVAVTVDEPTVNGYYGGVVAGPVFKHVMAGSLNVLGVSPTKPLKEASDAQIVQAARKP